MDKSKRSEPTGLETVATPACCDSVLFDACCGPEIKPACCGPVQVPAKCGCASDAPGTARLPSADLRQMSAT